MSTEPDVDLGGSGVDLECAARAALGTDCRANVNKQDIHVCVPISCVTTAGITHELLEHGLASSVCRRDLAARRRCLCVRGRCVREVFCRVLGRGVC